MLKTISKDPTDLKEIVMIPAQSQNDDEEAEETTPLTPQVKLTPDYTWQLIHHLQPTKDKLAKRQSLQILEEAKSKTKVKTKVKTKDKTKAKVKTKIKAKVKMMEKKVQQPKDVNAVSEDQEIQSEVLPQLNLEEAIQEPTKEITKGIAKEATKEMAREVISKLKAAAHETQTLLLNEKKFSQKPLYLSPTCHSQSTTPA